MQEYADPVIDWLDAGQGILRRRFFREVGATSRSLIVLAQKGALTRSLGCSPVPSYQTGHTARISPSLSKIFREFASLTILRFAIA
jgi:hypothetical protein